MIGPAQHRDQQRRLHEHGMQQALLQLRGLARLLAEHQVADPDQQVALGERLDDEVLGAVVEELHHQLFIRLGREQQDRRVLQLRPRPHLRDHLDAADVRHHDVGHDDHRVEAQRLLDPFAAVERRRHVIVAAQALHDEAVHVGVVLDDEDARPSGDARNRGGLGRLRFDAGEAQLLEDAVERVAIEPGGGARGRGFRADAAHRQRHLEAGAAEIGVEHGRCGPCASRRTPSRSPAPVPCPPPSG